METSHDLGLYIHIPFCRQRCHFCPFYFEIARTERQERFLSALTREIELIGHQGLLARRPLRSIYFGGGTPTAIPVHHLVSLLALIRATWATCTNTEVTVEAHPSTITHEGLAALADAGFNRISFGAESMNSEDFASIGRTGMVQDNTTAVVAARAVGFANINLDLMYGLPGQSLEAWIETVQCLLELNPSHVSCYALTIEDGTKLAQDVTRNRVPAPDEALQVEMESVAEMLLTGAGFSRYEISNYARPGATCRHNLLYWTAGDYLGLGPSAQSYVNGVRFGNIGDLTAYSDILDRNCLPIAECTTLSAAEQQRDALVFGLRLIQGVPVRTAEGTRQRRALEDLVARRLLEADAEVVRLTPLGRRYADTVAGELF